MLFYSRLKTKCNRWQQLFLKSRKLARQNSMKNSRIYIQTTKRLSFNTVNYSESRLPFFIEFCLASFQKRLLSTVAYGFQSWIDNTNNFSGSQLWPVIAFVHIIVKLPTSPSFIRIHFKTLRNVCVISSFYKASVQFLSRSIELILK